jgi:hypothetical protein
MHTSTFSSTCTTTHAHARITRTSYEHTHTNAHMNTCAHAGIHPCAYTQTHSHIHAHAYIPTQDTPSTEGRHECTWVGGVFTPLEDCFISKFSLHLKLTHGKLLRFRLILAEWDPHTAHPGVGRPGKQLYASEPMELVKDTEDHVDDTCKNGYRCFTLQLPEDGNTGGVRKGSTLILAASTEGLHTDEHAEASVGCVHKLVVGAVLNSLVWLHGGVSSDEKVRFESVEHTLAGCIHMMSIARMLRGGPALPSKGRTSPLQPADETVSETEPPESPAKLGGWSEEQLEELPLLLWNDEDRGFVGVASDVLTAGPEDLENIRSALPLRCAMHDWELLYSTRRSGLSMNTFFRSVTGKKDCVLLIRDDQGHTVCVLFICVCVREREREREYACV